MFHQNREVRVPADFQQICQDVVLPFYPLVQPGFNNGRETPQFLLNDFRFLHENMKYAVFRPLLVDKVVAIHDWCALQFAIDTPIPLFQAAWVPWNIEVEEVGAVDFEGSHLHGPRPSQ